MKHITTIHATTTIQPENIHVREEGDKILLNLHATDGALFAIMLTEDTWVDAGQKVVDVIQKRQVARMRELHREATK